MDSSLLKQLRDRASDPKRATDDSSRVQARIFSPIDELSVASAESRLGFRLPAPLRALYTTVGNGGFGPAILGLVDGARNEDGLDAVGVYFRSRMPSSTDPLWVWPESLLPVGHLGCGMFTCVDCNSEDASLVWFEPNPHERGDPWDDAFIPLNLSLEDWLRRWLDGAEDDLFESAWKAKFGEDDG